MSDYCCYHPTVQAYWRCPTCDSAFCNNCVDKRVVEQYGAKNTYHFCPKCNVEVERIAFEDTVDPFWNRLPKFFVYPFKPWPLILMVVLAILFSIFPGKGLFGLLMRFAFWAVILKYSYAVLKNTARGQINTPPKINSSTISDEFEIVFKQIILFFILIFAFFWVTRTFGPLIGILFACFLILSLPSIIIVLVTTNSLLHAINPIIFVGMAIRIGWSYLVMYLFLIMLLGAPAVLWRYILSYFPTALYPFLLFSAKAYYTIVAYHLMGYVLFQYHEEIGYHVDLDDEEFESKPVPSENDPEGELMEKVNMLIKDGRMEDAVVFIKSETKGNIKNPDLAERYYNLLKLTQRIPEMLKHGKSYLELLSRKNNKEKLLEVFSELSGHDGFVTIPETSFKIAGCFNEAGKPREAIQVYNRFIKENSGNHLIPKAYFLAANIFNEKLNNPKKAAGILKSLIKKYHGHEIIPYVENYLGQMGVK